MEGARRYHGRVVSAAEAVDDERASSVVESVEGVESLVVVEVADLVSGAWASLLSLSEVPGALEVPVAGHGVSSRSKASGRVE